MEAYYSPSLYNENYIASDLSNYGFLDQNDVYSQLGIRIKQYFNPKSALTFSINYSNLKFEDDCYWHTLLPDGGHTSTVIIDCESSYTEKHNFIGFDLLYSYRLINVGKLSIYAFSGVSVDFLFSGTRKIAMDDGSIEKYFKRRRKLDGIYSNFGLGLDYSLSKSFKVFIEPLSSFKFKSKRRDEGLNLGLSFLLK